MLLDRFAGAGGVELANAERKGERGPLTDGRPCADSNRRTVTFFERVTTVTPCPYKDPTAAKLANRERQRRHREKLRGAKAAAAVTIPPNPDDPVSALATWAATVLKVPPGHPLAGQPMALPPFTERFLREGWDAHESAQSMARKNGKTGTCAVLALGFLCGPLRVLGWRGAIASVTKEKAAELRNQVAAIAEASGLAEINVRRSPYPGAIESTTGVLETLSADRDCGPCERLRPGVDRRNRVDARTRPRAAGRAPVQRVREGRPNHPYQRPRRLAAVRRGSGEPGERLSRLRGAGRLPRLTTARRGPRQTPDSGRSSNCPTWRPRLNASRVRPATSRAFAPTT